MLIRIDPENPKKNYIQGAANIAGSGGIIIFPTDTIYGVGTSSYSLGGIMRLFSSKKRDMDKPLGIFVSTLEMLMQHCVVKPEYLPFLRTIWPGPITCVFGRQVDTKKFYTTPNKAQLPTVAVRIPNNPITMMLVECLGHPILQTSVNISGLPHNSYEELQEHYAWFADAMIDGGPEQNNQPSTIINLAGSKCHLIREGGAPWAEIEQKLNEFGVNH